MAKQSSFFTSISRLYPHVRPILPRLVMGLLCALLASVMALAIPQVLRVLVNESLTPGGSAEAVWTASLLILVLGIAEAGLVALRRQFVINPATTVETRMRVSLYGHLQDLTVSFHDRWGSGQLLSRAMTDLNFLRRWMAFGAIMLVVTTLTVVIGVAVMFAMSWQLALIFLAAAVPIMIYGFRFRTRFSKVARRSQDQAGDLATTVEESVHGIRVLKAFGRSREALENFNEQAEELRQTEIAKAKHLATFSLVVTLLPELALGAGLVVGILLASTDQLSIGSLVAFFATAAVVAAPVEFCGMLLAMALTAKSAVDRHFEVMDAQNTITSPDQPRRPAGLKGALSFRNASFAFEDAPDKPILKDITLDIRPGETMALVGITGGGKSALLQLVPRLYDVTGGSITIDGVDLREFGVEELRTVVAVAFEDTTLFSSSVRDNVLLGAPDAGSGGGPRRGPGGSPRRRPGPLRLLPAGRGGHPDRRGGPQPLRRPAPAHRPGPRHRRETGRAGPGRPALGAGRQHRGARRGQAARGPRGHHHADRGPPALHGGAGRPGGPARGRPDHRRRNPRGTARQEQPLPLRDRQPGPGTAGPGFRIVRPRGPVRGDFPMSSATFGTANEDNAHLSRNESKAVRRRSLTLLGSLIRPVRARFWLTIGAVVLSQAARVAGPALIAFGIDHALPALRAGDNLPLVLTGAAYLAAAVVAAGLTALYVTSTARLSQAMLLDLRVRVFRHTQRLSLEFHEKYTSGRIIARQTSDLEALRELLDSGVSSLASGMLFMAFTAVTVFALDWRSGVLVLAAGVPMYFLARWYQKHSQIAFRESRVVSARLIVHFVETMTGIRAVKAFRKERENAAGYAELSEDYRRATVRSINLNGIFQPGLVLIGNVCVALVLLTGGFRVLSGDLEVGVLLALILSTKRFFQPVDQMAMFYNSFQSAQAALEKVSGLLEEVPTVRPPKTPAALHDARGSIDFNGVEFRYGDGPVVIPRLDLHIPAGQTVALVGQTGAGKSTLAKLIARFYDVSAGSLTLDGVDLRQLSTEDLRRNVVMVTQEAFLFSGSVADNIALGRPEASREEIEDAARAVGAHAFIMELPDGYDTDVNKRGGRVSAGQRQLISFARAFLARPAVLILDEATSSLDIPSERMVQQGLAGLLRGTREAGTREAASGRPVDRRAADSPLQTGPRPGLGPGAGRTALIIAHRLSTVETADRVLVVHDGRVVEDGTPEQLIGDGGAFARLHGAWKDSLV